MKLFRPDSANLTGMNYRTIIGALLLPAILLSPLVFSYTPETETLQLTRLFPTELYPSVSFAENLLASPLFDPSETGGSLIVSADGGIALLDGKTGASLANIDFPAPYGQSIDIVATPLRFGDILFVLYQTIKNGQRNSHRLVAVDLRKHEIDARFAPLELSALARTIDGKTIAFNAPTAYSHAAVKHLPGVGAGYLYASFGNAGDTQPFHGWIFEIDIDAWRQHGAANAVRSTLVTTAESECPVNYEFGTQEMICGGGIWNPAGPQVDWHHGEASLLVATGNGQLDLARRDYANTVMRVKPGLDFDPGCDARLCANFAPSAPEESCLASCKNLFIPRLLPGGKPLRPADGACDGKTFAECLAWMDYDLGANAPIKVELPDGPPVIVQAGKEGGVYLIDAEHLGKLYDRLQIADICGTAADPCKMGWRGMIVTSPVQTKINGAPIVIVPTFMSDDSQPAGLVALKIVMSHGRPKFERFWQFPAPGALEAKTAFRSHPSFPLITYAGSNREPYVWIVDIPLGMQSGTLYAVRARDGALAVRQTLAGTGRPLSHLALYDGILYIASSAPGAKSSWLEAYRIDYRPPQRESAAAVN